MLKLSKNDNLISKNHEKVMNGLTQIHLREFAIKMNNPVILEMIENQAKKPKPKKKIAVKKDSKEENEFIS